MLFRAKIKKCGGNKSVLDTVMIAKGGAALLQQEAVQALKEYVLPVATVIIFFSSRRRHTRS
ncbi:hypothetical protein DB1_57640 [Bacillus anthracis]|uniref:Pyridoxamine kinase/Phosphomethylpyrimidine kinase domain-containing protein n=1 Tax=Bacillus anthracis TaxID=1392 RepID=A0A640LSI9_BACAN|nr:hypothetical protein DB1_57640 [Bacillus anthracis]